MRNIKFMVGRVSNEIYAGTLKRCGKIFAQKQIVTIDVLLAVTEHALNHEEPVIISKEDGTPEFKITVERL